MKPELETINQKVFKTWETKHQIRVLCQQLNAIVDSIKELAKWKSNSVDSVEIQKKNECFRCKESMNLSLRHTCVFATANQIAGEKEIPQFVKDRVKDMKFEEVWNGKEGYVGQKHQSDCCKAEVIVVSGDDGTGHWECGKCGKACNDTFIVAEQPEEDCLEISKQSDWEIQISQAIAAAYTHPENSHKVLDPDLIKSAVKEIMPVLSKTREEEADKWQSACQYYYKEGETAERARVTEMVEGMTFKDIGSTFTLDLTKEAAETGFNRTQIYLLNQIKK